MVDYEDADGKVQFASATYLYGLAEAKALARTVSKKHGSAAVVAYEQDGFVLGASTFLPVGHVMFSGGKQSDIDGVVA